MNGSSYGVVVCTIGKSVAKRHQNLKPGPFTPRESVVSNFYTNLYGATKSQIMPKFYHAFSAYRSREPSVPNIPKSVTQLLFCYFFSGLLSSYLGALQLLNISLVVGNTCYEGFEAGST